MRRVRNIETPQAPTQLLAAAGVLQTALKRSGATSLRELLDTVDPGSDQAAKVGITAEHWRLFGTHAYYLAGIRPGSALHWCPQCHLGQIGVGTLKKCTQTKGCEGKLLRARGARLEPLTSKVEG